jgi:hypothetical protein
MKRYLLSLAAVVIAIVAFSFTTSKRAVTHVFQFTGTPSVSNVQNISNSFWVYQGESLALCDDVQEKACRIEVGDSFVDNPSSPTKLKSITITATLQTSFNTAYVTALTGTGNIFSNQDH